MLPRDNDPAGLPWKSEQKLKFWEKNFKKGHLATGPRYTRNKTVESALETRIGSERDREIKELWHLSGMQPNHLILATIYGAPRMAKGHS